MIPGIQKQAALPLGAVGKAVATNEEEGDAFAGVMEAFAGAPKANQSRAQKRSHAAEEAAQAPNPDAMNQVPQTVAVPAQPKTAEPADAAAVMFSADSAVVAPSGIGPATQAPAPANSPVAMTPQPQGMEATMPGIGVGAEASPPKSDVSGILPGNENPASNASSLSGDAAMLLPGLPLRASEHAAPVSAHEQPISSLSPGLSPQAILPRAQPDTASPAPAKPWANLAPEVEETGGPFPPQSKPTTIVGPQDKTAPSEAPGGLPAYVGPEPTTALSTGLAHPATATGRVPAAATFTEPAMPGGSVFHFRLEKTSPIGPRDAVAMPVPLPAGRESLAAEMPSMAATAMIYRSVDHDPSPSGQLQSDDSAGETREAAPAGQTQPRSAGKAAEPDPDGMAPPQDPPESADQTAAVNDSMVDGDAAAAPTGIISFPPAAPLPSATQNLASSPSWVHALPPGFHTSLARAAAQADNDQVELTLDPVELGRVRFDLLRAGDQLQVTVRVERPETMDLMRRNADQLQAEFRQAGFSGATLSFGHWGQRPSGGQSAPLLMPEGEDPPPANAVFTPPPATRARSTGSSLDLRL